VRTVHAVALPRTLGHTHIGASCARGGVHLGSRLPPPRCMHGSARVPAIPLKRGERRREVRERLKWWPRWGIGGLAVKEWATLVCAPSLASLAKAVGSIAWLTAALAYRTASRRHPLTCTASYTPDTHLIAPATRGLPVRHGASGGSRRRGSPSLFCGSA
jgi:hypothetical protein